MKVTGRTKVFIHEYENGKETINLYSTSISNKLEDGTYQNMSINISFKNDLDIKKIEHKDDINIKDGFLTCYQNKDDKMIPVLKVLDYDFKIE